MVVLSAYNTAMNTGPLSFLRRHGRFFLLLAVALAILALSLASFYRAEPVLCLRVARSDALVTLTATGAIVADNAVSVSSPFQSRITGIHVREGDAITPGQPLVTLEAEDPQAALAQAQAQERQAHAALAFVQQGTRAEDLQRLKGRVSEAVQQRAQAEAELRQAQADADQAQRFWARMTPLARDGAISANDYEQASARAEAARQQVQSRVSAAQAATARHEQALADWAKGQAGPTPPERQEARAAYEAARQRTRTLAAQLGQRIIRSPLRGVALARVQEPGDIAMPGQPILRIADRATLQAQGYVEEADLSRVAVGQRCEVSLDARPDNLLPCVVRELGHEVNPENGTVVVKADLVPASGGSGARERVPLLPGMTADITFITTTLHQAMVLPATAVEKAGSGWRVYVIAQGRAHARAVSARRLSLENVQILSGLRPGEWVARAASADLLTRRRVVAQPAPAAEAR